MASASFRSLVLRPTLAERSCVRSISTRIAFLTINPQHSHKRKTTHLKKEDIPWRTVHASKSMSPPEFPHQNHHTPLSKVIHRFYSAINDKDLSTLHNLISDDCRFEDLAYFSTLERKRIQHFFKRLTEAMGKHVRFIIDGTYEGHELAIAVMWHLEWNGKFIPFTKGCSFYKCSRDSKEPLIKEARVFIESPLKPGDFAVKMLKMIISLFDRFPKLAESLLRKADTIAYFIGFIYKKFIQPLVLTFLVHFIATISKKCMEPLIRHFLVYHANVWKWVVAQVQSYALKILLQILKR